MSVVHMNRDPATFIPRQLSLLQIVETELLMSLI